MKHILQFLANIILFIVWSWNNFVAMVFWYGKLPKVSPYHSFKRSFTDKELFEEITAQSREFPDEGQSKYSNKKAIIDFLYKHHKLLTEDVKMFDEKGKHYGTQTLYSKLLDELNKS